MRKSNKKRTAYPKQYLATAHEIAPRRIGEKQDGTVNSRFTELFWIRPRLKISEPALHSRYLLGTPTGRRLILDGSFKSTYAADVR
ncbi:hypothetical protein AVEN_91144-1 [Araneus ventricosus]|uniref:Uncharacterized protein n=1 Tax=Araneus ventricosus TaxID=182803 RepID=A0A4Y2E516_ARAVE|nr:hypothetical protein AVEN_91144-1 [Araneus ventricosus]